MRRRRKILYQSPLMKEKPNRKTHRQKSRHTKQTEKQCQRSSNAGGPFQPIISPDPRCSLKIHPNPIIRNSSTIRTVFRTSCTYSIYQTLYEYILTLVIDTYSIGMHHRTVTRHGGALWDLSRSKIAPCRCRREQKKQKHQSRLVESTT